MIETMMNMLVLEYPDLKENIICCKEQTGGTSEDSNTKEKVGTEEESREESRGGTEEESREETEEETEKKPEKTNQIQPKTNKVRKGENPQEKTEEKKSSKIREKIVANKKIISEKQREIKLAEREYKTQNLKKINAEKSLQEMLMNPDATPDEIENARENIAQINEKMSKIINKKKKISEDIKDKKKQVGMDEREYVQERNKEFDKKEDNDKYENLFKKGPVNIIYKMFATAIDNVVTLVKMFFFWIYTTSMKTFLPFVMAMSFGMSFVKYLFQKAKVA